MNEDIENLKREIERLKIAVNSSAGQDAALQLVVAVMADQMPDTARLLRDFSAQTEDTNVRTMFSSRPESFYECFQQARTTWEQLLLATHQAKQRG